MGLETLARDARDLRSDRLGEPLLRDVRRGDDCACGACRAARASPALGLARALAIVLLISASVAANLAPSLIYRAEHGSNTALERSAAFTEQSDEAFSLRPANLVLPAPESRIAPLRDIAKKYDQAIAPATASPAMRASAQSARSAFCGWSLAALAALAGAGAVWLGARRLVRHASLGVILAVAVGTVGGLASLIEVFVTPDIRAWNRISVFIAFLSLLAVGLLLDMLRGALSRRRRGALLGGVASAAVLLFGVYDQTSASFVPSYAATAREWSSDAKFVQEIEATLPRGASVFQLPYVPFPEGYPETPVGDQVATYSTKYESLRGYLHSSTLRWSYGAMKGRAADWSAQLAGQPLSYVVAAAAAAGFDGLWVDPAGFEPARRRSCGRRCRACSADAACEPARRPVVLRPAALPAALAPFTLVAVRSACCANARCDR